MGGWGRWRRWGDGTRLEEKETIRRIYEIILIIEELDGIHIHGFIIATGCAAAFKLKLFFVVGKSAGGGAVVFQGGEEQGIDVIFLTEFAVDSGLVFGEYVAALALGGLALGHAEFADAKEDNIADAEPGLFAEATANLANAGVIIVAIDHESALAEVADDATDHLVFVNLVEFYFGAIVALARLIALSTLKVRHSTL